MSPPGALNNGKIYPEKLCGNSLNFKIQNQVL
jgi:hypothetical protein